MISFCSELALDQLPVLLQVRGYFHVFRNPQNSYIEKLKSSLEAVVKAITLDQRDAKISKSFLQEKVS